MEPVFGAIGSFLRDIGGDGQIIGALVTAAWRRHAGEQLGRHTRALAFDGDRLIVAVRDETWRRNLEDLSPRMIYQLNNELGDGLVKFIEFRVDKHVFEKGKPEQGAKSGSATDVPVGLAEAAAAITDDDLRRRFLSAAADCLSAKK